MEVNSKLITSAVEIQRKELIEKMEVTPEVRLEKRKSTNKDKKQNKKKRELTENDRDSKAEENIVEADMHLHITVTEPGENTIQQEVEVDPHDESENETRKQESAKLVQFRWSMEDEIIMLNALIKFKEEGKYVYKVPPEFLEMVQSRVSAHVSTDQISDKVRRMRDRFRKALTSSTYLARVDRGVFELSHKLWAATGTSPMLASTKKENPLFSLLSPLDSSMLLPCFDDVFKGQSSASEAYKRLSDIDKTRLEEKAKEIELKIQEVRSELTQLFDETIELMTESH